VKKKICNSKGRNTVAAAVVATDAFKAKTSPHSPASTDDDDDNDYDGDDNVDVKIA